VLFPGFKDSLRQAVNSALTDAAKHTGKSASVKNRLTYRLGRVKPKSSLELYDLSGEFTGKSISKNLTPPLRASKRLHIQDNQWRADKRSSFARSVGRLSHYQGDGLDHQAGSGGLARSEWQSSLRAIIV
jgi:hypothetical protein